MFFTNTITIISPDVLKYWNAKVKHSTYSPTKIIKISNLYFMDIFYFSLVGWLIDSITERSFCTILP